MSDWREFAYEADRDSGIEYGSEDFDTEIRRLRARIRELEERLHDATAKYNAAAYAANRLWREAKAALEAAEREVRGE